MFRKEILNLQQLHQFCQQVPNVTDYFEENDLFFFVQDYIKGIDCWKYIDKYGPLNQNEIYQLLKSVVNTLQIVHRHKIIHRDIKPDNILIVGSNYYLIDFGIARELGPMETHGSTVIGCHGFMAPEVYFHRTVYQSDFYSLGVTAFVLLGGKTEEMVEFFHQVKTEGIIHERLSNLLLNMIELDFQKRPRNCSEILQALEME